MEKREASDLSKQVAAELRADRGRRGWTLKSVERATGIPYRSLNRMINGEAEISVAHLIAFADAIGSDARTIIDETERHARREAAKTTEVSAAPDNVTVLHETDWDTYEGRKAANNDPEASEDEPAGP